MNTAVVFFAFAGFVFGVNGECGSCTDYAYVKDPVCGFDGTSYQTFQNTCYFKMAVCKYTLAGQKLALAYRGECKTASASTGAVKPSVQLGTNTLTATADKCSAITCTSTEKYPICGSDGNTYLNKCEFTLAECKYRVNGQVLNVAYLGECRTDTKPSTQLGTVDTKPSTQLGTTTTTDSCNMNCDSTTKYPICGTNGVTYMNKCYFYEAKCEKDASGEKFDVAYIGACKTATSLTGSVLTAKTDCSSTTRCYSTPQRICGSDGNVYGSQCEFLRAQCANPRLTQERCAAASLSVSALG